MTELDRVAHAGNAVARVIRGDVAAVRDLEAMEWNDVVRAMQSDRSPINREAAERALLASRDPRTSNDAWRWGTLVREGNIGPWVQDDRGIWWLPGQAGAVEIDFEFEPGFEDAILDVVHRLDDINLDGPIDDSELEALLNGIE